MRLPGSTRERPLAARRRAGTRSARESCRTPRGCAPRSPWSAIRLVRKTATVGLEGNTYSVDSFLTGRKVELDVYWQGRKAGKAVLRVISRHAHPKAPPDERDPVPAEPTGINYLKLVADADNAALAGRLRLSALDDGHGPPGPANGQDRDDGEEQSLELSMAPP